jgi:DNA-binding transcriptional regulator LsrR (DeoR family)
MPAGSAALPDWWTVGPEWRDRRDRVIVAAARAGVSQRILSDVFDLSRRRVREVIESARENRPHKKS